MITYDMILIVENPKINKLTKNNKLTKLHVKTPPTHTPDVFCILSIKNI